MIRRPRSLLAPLLGILATALLGSEALGRGGAFVVDDANFEKPGACKVENWASYGNNGDTVYVTSPNCVFDFGLGHPVEVNPQFERSRTEGQWITTGTLQVKA